MLLVIDLVHRINNKHIRGTSVFSVAILVGGLTSVDVTLAAITKLAWMG